MATSYVPPPPASSAVVTSRATSRWSGGSLLACEAARRRPTLAPPPPPPRTGGRRPSDEEAQRRVVRTVLLPARSDRSGSQCGAQPRAARRTPPPTTLALLGTSNTIPSRTTPAVVDAYSITRRAPQPWTQATPAPSNLARIVPGSAAPADPGRATQPTGGRREGRGRPRSSNATSRDIFGTPWTAGRRREREKPAIAGVSDGPCWNRTNNLGLKRPLLCQLS